MPLWKRKGPSDEEMARHLMPWLAFTQFVDLRGEGAEISDEELGSAWRDCIGHYGLEAAESMNSRMVDAVASARSELEKKVNLGRLLPPIEECPTCRRDGT